MLEETDPMQKVPVDPSVNSHKPSSGASQDISQILASIFKDVYTNEIIGKHTFSNLVKTKNGRSSFHEKYIKELQQAYSLYDQCIKEADMVENHIIKARAQATDKERQEYERITEDVGDVSGHQELFTVKSAFSWCVDEDLLKRNNLISPGDYLITEKPQVQARTTVKSSLTKPTITHLMHTSREPQDDGCTLIPRLKNTGLEMNELDDSITFESSSDSVFNKKRTTKTKPDAIKPRSKWMDEPSAKDREEAREKLQRLTDQNSYLRNPRFLSPKARQGGTSLIRAKVKNKHERKSSEDQSSCDDPAPVFRAQPSVIVFTDYIVGHVYESTLELKNTTSTSRHVRVIPPTTSYFSIGLGRFPGEGGVVAPGMSCKYTLRFAPDSLGEYKDSVMVETQSEHLLVVPIEARRPPPILTLPRVLDCGYCLVGGVTFVEFLCQNVGLSSGTFYIIPKDQWPVSNLRSVSRTYFSERPPFAVGPTLFTLQPGEATVLEVVFFPTTAERICQIFTVVCDNCQVKDISIEGEGQLVALELVSVSGEDELPLVGEVHDLTAEHRVHFSPCNPHSVQQKRLVIRNNVHLELPFHWQIMKPNLHPLLPGETPEPSQIQFHPVTDDIFHVSPTTGLLVPCQDQEFLLTFSPKELKDYHSVCHLVLTDVPQPAPESNGNSGLQPVQTVSKLIGVIVMEIEVKGSTEPYQILLEPYAVVIPGENLICTTIRRQFKMWNHSKTFVLFQWERLKSSCHVIEVEPSAGRIEENECFDFTLILTGGKPEKVATSLVCNIQHHHKSIVLAVEVTFKGPTVTLSVPSVDFGLVRLGEQTQTTLLLTNTTHVESSWMLEEKLQHHQNTQILVKPRRGVLPPLASCEVDVVFRPRLCQQFETELQLSVENGTECHVLVRADVQSPQACLLSCSLVLSELYVGVPVKGGVTVFNQTLLPSHFTWMAELRGKQAALCAASFDPSSGVLGPNESVDITVTFTSHTDSELTEVAAVCEIEGMKSPLILSIVTSKPKTLFVSYSLPGVCPSQDDPNLSALVLDFGEDVVLKKAVTKQLLITNQTAIPASFTIEAEYFTCHVSEPNNQAEKRFTDLKVPRHLLQAKKAEAKAHEEFVSSILAHGKGAAFHVSPDSGLLGPFETQTVDVTAYTDMWGEYRDHLICKMGDLEPTCVPMQMIVKGCPLYFQMTGPRADDQHLGPTIHFGTHVSGGDTVSRSVRINNPTMFDIRLDWETYNVDQNDGKLVDVVVAYGERFPLKDDDGNELPSEALRFSSVRPAWERTHTPVSDRTRASPQSVTEFVSEEEKTGRYPSAAKTSVISVHIRPHLGNLSDYPYCITPQQIVIPAKSSGTVRVSFTPLTLSGSDCESRCAGFALGFMNLDSEMDVCIPGKVRRALGLDLEPVRMDLQAAVKPAVLLVQMDEDGGVLEFNASAGDLLRAESDEKVVVHEFGVTRTFELINTAEVPLRFRLETKLPFSVLKPQPRSRTSSTSSHPFSGDSQTLMLQPQHSVQVKVAFHCSLPLLDHEDQAEEGVSPGVRLIHTGSGQRKLRFQQNLLIHYSNNNLQTVPLCAHLDLLTLSLSSDSVNFGFCYVGQTQTREIDLQSLGAHTYWKSFTTSCEGDPCVFKVTPDFGLLRSKKPHMTTCIQCLQISFTPSDDKEFQAVVVFLSPLLKIPLTLQLQGTGSFDEAYRSQSLSL